MMVASDITSGLMGLETDYQERTVDDHIDDFDALGIL
jgi:hypothetical protein